MSWRDIIGVDESTPKPYPQYSQNTQNSSLITKLRGFEDIEDIGDGILPLKNSRGGIERKTNESGKNIKCETCPNYEEIPEPGCVRTLPEISNWTEQWINLLFLTECPEGTLH